MEQQLCYNVNHWPKAAAILDEGARITYQELVSRADVLARHMQQKGVHAEEPIGIYIGPGTGQIIAQVAVLRAGGTCVPVDPSVPYILLRSMLADLGTRFVITTDQLVSSITDFEVIGIGLSLNMELPNGHPGHVPLMADRPDSHRSHILHTSGSTGKPKPVQILARGIIHLATESPIRLQPFDRTAEINNPGFDLSLFEIWVSLLSGAAIVPIPKQIAIDPFAIRGVFEQYGVTAMILPSALFTILASSIPGSFGNMRHIIVAGEPPNVAAMRRVLESESPPGNLWNGYGPTEATCFSALHRVTIEETYRQSISAGKPVGQTQLFILDQDLQPIEDIGREGEICIGGPGVSAGYYNWPETNAEKFIHIRIPRNQEQHSSSPKTVRVYRTGDIGFWREGGQIIEYVGRADTQVKHKGFRVELGAIERVIEEHKHVQAAAVIQLKGQSQSDGYLLIAWVILADKDHGKAETSCGSLLQDIISWLAARLPYYMIPNHAWETRKFPHTPYGKIDRRALVEQAQDQMQHKIKDAMRIKNNEAQEVPKQHVSMTNKQSLSNVPKTLATLRSLLQDVLPMAGSFDPDDNIMSLGLTSLDAARFIGLVNKHIGPLSMQDLHQNVTLASLAQLLGKTHQTNYGPAELLEFENDSHLADDIELVPDWRSEGRIFLTGATGYVGAQILHRLLRMPQLNHVACLARWDHRHGVSPAGRIKNTFKKYDLWDEAISELFEQKVSTLDGDITKPHLGLEDKDYQWLVNWAPAILHVAAKVNWCEPYSSHFEPNVLGTKNVLRVASHGRRKSFHYVSSIDIWGVTGLILGTEAVSEDGPLKVHLASLPFDTGYAQSQWVADEMVQRAQKKGLPITIYRPGFVVGDSIKAAGNPDDFFSRMIVGCIQLGYWPELPEQNMEYVTADYVCDAFLHLAADNRNIGRNFNLTAPDPSKITTMERLCRLINQAGFSVTQIPYNDWLAKLRTWKGLEESPLLSLMPLFSEPVLRGATRLQTSKFSPVYECPNTQKALVDRPDIRYTQLCPDLIRRFVDFWLRKGFHRI